jgi:hypothetical protein
MTFNDEKPPIMNSKKIIGDGEWGEFSAFKNRSQVTAPNEIE